MRRALRSNAVDLSALSAATRQNNVSVSRPAGEGKEDDGYMHVSVCELKHPPPQLCPMPEGLSSQQVCVTLNRRDY